MIHRTVSVGLHIKEVVFLIVWCWRFCLGVTCLDLINQNLFYQTMNVYCACIYRRRLMNTLVTRQQQRTLENSLFVLLFYTHKRQLWTQKRPYWEFCNKIVSMKILTAFCFVCFFLYVGIWNLMGKLITAGLIYTDSSVMILTLCVSSYFSFIPLQNMW